MKTALQIPASPVQPQSVDLSTPMRHVKVLKLHILKPANGMKWDELGKVLREARYRVFRLANMSISDSYLDFHSMRTGQEDFEKSTIGEVNRGLRDMLDAERIKKNGYIPSERFSKEGALPAAVVDALSMYKLKGLTSKSKWSEVTRGKSALPTFRLNMAIPVRCEDKCGERKHRRLEKTATGNIEVDLQICLQPYPRVVIATARESLGDGQRAIMKRLLDNPQQDESGYRQRCFEIKEDSRSKKWHLFVTYDFPASEASNALSEDRIVGVDLGFSCPMYAAINNGHARLGWKHFAALAHRIKTLQSETMARRRQIQRGGKAELTKATARAGHGRNRKLQPIQSLEGKIDRAYTTLNHQLSASVVKFAQDNGAGIIQMEDLNGLGEALSGTFLGERWRYFQLQSFIQYKSDEVGIKVRFHNPQYTSRRCSECGHIHMEFTRDFRDTNRINGKPCRFKCPKCGYEADADYNAARNHAVKDIGNIIAEAISAV